ncbi:MAG: VWA domain-containing protein [Clostridiaceae bacterium]|nr:VWA domain-containing protein [Clostridiaceae bacterium]
MLEPGLLSLKLAPGQDVTEEKSVTIPLPEKLDILFAYDLTGSMAGIINAAKSSTVQLINKLEELGIDINYGVVSYMDYPNSYDSYGYSATYGSAEAGDYAYRLDQPITDDTTAVLNAINALTLGDGADTPQNYTRIFYESYSAPNISWRDGAKRVLLNFADAIPHDDNLNEGVPGKTGVRSTGGDPGRDEVMFTSDDLDLQTVLAEMAENKVTLIDTHANTIDIEYWNYWTGITGGQTFLIASENFVDDVYNSIISTLSSVTELRLVASAGFKNWIKSVEPEYFSGVATEPVKFLLRLRVPPNTADGFYSFTISAVDSSGAIYGEQLVRVEVITNKTAGGIDVEYIAPVPEINEAGCKKSNYVYPARFVMGILEEDNVLAEGIYHTLINIQNNTPRRTKISIRVSVPASFGKDSVVTKPIIYELEPFQALQISGGKINNILYQTPFYNSSFLTGTVLITSRESNLGVSAIYTYYQTNYIV